MKFLILYALVVFATAQDKCKLYECDPINFNKVTVLVGSEKLELSCSPGTKCNRRFVQNCVPCIPDNCDDVFTCNGQDVDIFGSSPMQCGILELCNTEDKEPCNKFCIDVVCERGFRCIDSTTYYDERQFIEGTCQTGDICNKEFMWPCIPCIKDDNPTTTPLPTTTTTITTTTTQKTTTITPKPFVKPNCNDGGGWSKPCREGPSGYYIKCKLEGYKYETHKLSCKDILSDSKCRSAKVCLN